MAQDGNFAQEGIVAEEGGIFAEDSNVVEEGELAKEGNFAEKGDLATRVTSPRMVFLMKRASPLRHEGQIRRGRLFAIESYYSRLCQGRQFAEDGNCATKGGRAKGGIFAKEGNVTVEGDFSKGG